VGAVMQGRIGMGEALMIECAALSMATAATGLVDLHRLFKPLTMGFAVMVVVQAGLVARKRGESSARGIGWLLAALAASLAGDAFLMFDGFFLPGLLAFLLAHLAYTALFRQDASLMAAPRAALLIALLGLAVFALLWIGGLPAALRAPVSVYVLAIAVMASWAVSRATVLADGPAWAVAVGAICFLVSDATLAVNRFVMPLPHSAVWVLTTYYAAQCLLVMGWLRGRVARRASGWADQGA
jgi:uncharacterized membrane protein YhhN